MKDLFSGHAKLYATARPEYPDDLYAFILEHVQGRDNAWDCATGNGQVAKVLCQHFKNVEASDISAPQLKEAYKAANITYTQTPAEKTPYPDQHFDLITVGQALHWFDFEVFFAEVKRVLKPNGFIAAWGYEFIKVDDEIDSKVLHFYNHVVGPYWDERRKYVEEAYTTINFPFAKITRASFNISLQWTLSHLTAYLESWSATQKYIQQNGQNPVDALRDDLSTTWKDNEVRTVTFPVFLVLGEG